MFYVLNWFVTRDVRCITADTTMRRAEFGLAMPYFKTIEVTRQKFNPRPEFADLVCCGGAFKYRMMASPETSSTDVKILHFRVILSKSPQLSFMVSGNLGGYIFTE